MTIDEEAISLHAEWKGKIDTTAKMPVDSRHALSVAYTPGVAAGRSVRILSLRISIPSSRTLSRLFLTALRS